MLALLVGGAFAAAPEKATRRVVRTAAWADGEAAIGDVTASVNGMPARVTQVKRAGDDLLLLVVCDLAGDLALVEAAKAALTAFGNAIPPRTMAGLLRAQDGLQVVLDPTQDAAAWGAAVQALPATGRAGLLDTVESALRLASGVVARSGVRVGVLYVTDSSIHNYRDDYTNPVINSSDTRDLSRRFGGGLVREKTTQLATALSSAAAPLAIVHLDYRSDALNEAYQTGLREVAAATGGETTFCRSASEIPGAIAAALAHLESHWSVTVELPDKAAPAGTLSLTVAGQSLVHRPRYASRRDSQ